MQIHICRLATNKERYSHTRRDISTEHRPCFHAVASCDNGAQLSMQWLPLPDCKQSMCVLHRQQAKKSSAADTISNRVHLSSHISSSSLYFVPCGVDASKPEQGAIQGGQSPWWQKKAVCKPLCNSSPQRLYPRLKTSFRDASKPHQHMCCCWSCPLLRLYTHTFKRSSNDLSYLSVSLPYSNTVCRHKQY